MNKIINIKVLILIITLVMVCLITTNSFAQENYSVGMTLTSNSTLKEGEIVTLKANLTSINADKGIDTVVAELEYDKNIFENVEVVSGSNWNASYAPSTNMITAIKNSKTTQAETPFTIKLRVKTTNADSSKIILKNVVASGGAQKFGGTGDILVKNMSVAINKPQEEKVNYSVTMGLTGNSNFKNGETITINANVKSVNAGAGINTIVTKLEYDKNIFENVEVTSRNGWKTTYAPSTNMITAIKDSKITKSEMAFTITLKAKSIVDNNSTLVALTNTVVSGGAKKFGGTDDISVSNISISLNKIAETVSNTAKTKTTNTITNQIAINESIDAKELEKVENIENIANIENLEAIKEIVKVSTTQNVSILNSNIVSDKEETPKVELLLENTKNVEQEKQERIVIGTTAVSMISAASYVFFIKPKFII